MSSVSITTSTSEAGRPDADRRWMATATETYEVRDPYRNTVVSHAPRSTRPDLDDAREAAVRLKAKAAAMPAHERTALLRRAGTLLVDQGLV